MRRRLARLRPFGPVIGPTNRRDTAASAAGAGLALLLCVALIIGSGGDHSSGVFLIALPNSPLAQPWSAIVGNTVSALVALGVHQDTRDPALAIGASACLSLGAMFLTRSLHPPGAQWR